MCGDLRGQISGSCSFWGSIWVCVGRNVARGSNLGGFVSDTDFCKTGRNAVRAVRLGKGEMSYFGESWLEHCLRSRSGSHDV